MAKKPETETTEVAVQQPMEMAIPTDHIVGFEGMSMDDIQLPIAKLIQPIMLGKEKYEGQKPGTLVNEMTNEVVPHSLVALQIKDDKVMFPPQDEDKVSPFIATVEAATGVRLTPEDLKASYICRATDNLMGDRFGKCANCGLAEWNGNVKPLCTKNINVMCLFEGEEIPTVIQFSNTSHKHGKNFKQAAFMSKSHLFSRKYKISISKKEEGKKLWYEMALKPDGKVESQEEIVGYYKVLMQFRDLFVRQLESVVIREDAVPMTKDAEGEY